MPDALQSGQHAEQERTGTTEERRPGQDGDVQADLVEAGHVARRHADEAREDGAAGQRAEHTAGDDEQPLFDEELADQAPAAAADGCADAELVGARRAPVQEQDGQIDARDEQEKADRSGEHRERRRHVLDDAIGERGELHIGAFIGLRVLECQRGGDRLHLRSRGGHADARFQTAKRVEIRAAAAALHPAIVRRDLPIEQQVHVRRRHESKVRRQHADHGEGSAERDRPADRRGVAAELAHPEAVADDGGRDRIRTRVGLVEEAPAERRHAEHLKEARRDASRFKTTGELPARDDDRVGERTGQAVERAGAAAPVLEVWPRDAGSALFRDEHQPIGVRIRQRPHQHGVPDREDGRCRADAQDEQGERGDREPWRASEDPCRVSDLAPGGVEPDRANIADRFCRVRQSTDVPERQPARLVGRYAARAMALHLALDVVLKLLADFAVDPAATGETTQERDQTGEHEASHGGAILPRDSERSLVP